MPLFLYSDTEVLSQDQMWCVDLRLSLYVRLGEKKNTHNKKETKKQTKNQEDDTEVM